MKPVAVAIAGPTGTGKTEASLFLARALNCEIVGMDSMQIYRGMDIGTAKASPEERASVPHHMIGFLPVTAAYTVADYRRDALAVMDGITARGLIPMLVGGTGMYLDALSYERTYGEIPGDDAYRRKLHEIADAPDGRAKLHAMLRETDPAAAEKLHPNDVRRVIRALEVAAQGNETHKAVDPPGKYRILAYGLTMPREKLYERIDLRVDRMILAGLYEEIETLLSAAPADTWGGAQQAIGYKELLAARAGEISMEEAVRLIKRNSRRYAKRQMTWFRRDGRIVWFDVSAYESAAALHAAMLNRIRTDLSRNRPDLKKGALP